MSNDHDILARTLYGEARGEFQKTDGGLAALIAVGNVIMNRVKHPTCFQRTVQEVCQHPFQFSCWNANDPNARIVRDVTDKNALFKECLRVAQNVMDGTWPDLTQGCDHYHTIHVAPYWSRGKKPKYKVGRHIFFKLC